MDKEQKVVTVRRPDILKRLNAESLQLIERGFLGDIPDKLKPRPAVPARATSKDLVVAKPSSFLSACLPMPDSPVSEKASDEENQSQLSSSPLKKSFSFRGFSRISFLRKNKEKPKRKPIDETGAHGDDDGSLEDSQESRRSSRSDFDQNKSHKRFLFFRQKEMEKIEKNRKSHVYKRSKSFEFLPKAIEEDEDLYVNKKNSSSFIFSSTDTMGDAWTSNDSLEYITNVYYDNEDGVFLKSVKEISSESSKNNSSVSTISSAPSGLALTCSSNIKANESIFEGQSFENLLKEFDKAVDMFSENYLSDCEPYTQSDGIMQMKEKRKSSSFSTLPSPKVLQSSKVCQVSEDFKVELSRIVRQKRASAVPCLKSPRRGSVTDWFVLEDKAGSVAGSPPMSEQNKYRRAQKRPVNRVRRISSTKYVSIYL